MPGDSSIDLLALTSHLVRAYLNHNNLPAGDLPPLIHSTFESLAQLGVQTPTSLPAESFVGAVSVRKSLASPDHIISMIDGKPYRTLKRHVGTYGLTPDQYRDKYKLAADYPMVAPAYAAERSAMAKRIGLGRKPVQSPAPAPARRKLKIVGPKIG